MPLRGIDNRTTWSVRKRALARQRVVLGQSLLDAPIEKQLSVVEHTGTSADSPCCAAGMGDEDDGLSIGLKTLERLDAPLLKVLIADGKDLVQQKNVWVEVRGDGKGQSHVHA